jgi:hypothetical protein
MGTACCERCTDYMSMSVFGRSTITVLCSMISLALLSHALSHPSPPSLCCFAVAVVVVVVAYISGVAPRSSSASSCHRFSTALYGALPESDMTADQLKIKDISNKWAEVRLLSREEAESSLEPEWLEAYNRFHEKYDDDMTRMQEYAERIQKMIEPPKVERKSLKQKKRDAVPRVLAREAARKAM